MKKILLISIMTCCCAVFSALTLAENASPDLKTAIQKKDAKMIKQAVDNLVQQNNEKSFNTLSDALNSLGPTPEPAAYWAILEGMGRFTNKDVMTKVANLIIANKNKNLGDDLLAAMKANRTSTVIPLLSILLEKGTYEMQLECIHQLGAINAKESLEALANFLKTTTDKSLIKDVISSLRNITGLDRGNYPEPWVQWWDENKSKDASELIHPKKIDNIEHVGQYRDMKGIETLEKDKILVLRNDKCDKNTPAPDGNFDKIQNVLERLGIPHTVIGRSEFDKDSYSLDDKWAIVINCTLWAEHCCNPEHYKLKPVTGKGGIRLGICPGKDNHQNHSVKLSDKTIKKIAQFVETGGYLFTEDLNIEEVIERAFKGYITHTKFLPEKEVKIVPAPGAALHPYLKYVFEAPPSSSNQTTTSESKPGETTSVKQQDFRIDAEWRIDDESPDIKILKKDVVTVLIVSPQLAKENKSEGAVAVTWSYSKPMIKTGSDKPTYMPGGKVLHVMSHFGKQRSKLDEFALQNLILNFFMELNEQRPKVKKN
jgi:hypothetical protein